MEIANQPCCDDSCCGGNAVKHQSARSSNERLKEIVKEKYSQIALEGKDQAGGCGCGSGCGCSNELVVADEYGGIEGYAPEADLGLGCGIPTAVITISEGSTVLDLGSGAGNDAFIARKIVGEKGRVIGVDMTEAMVDRASENNRKLSYRNVEFRFGEIENLPVASRSVDVVLSNCVLNLVPNKRNAFAEVFRVLKPGAQFAISDIVVTGELPESVRSSAELYAGCVSGATAREEYLGIIRQQGFVGVEVKKEKRIELPDEILRRALGDWELQAFRNSGAALLSITVVGRKPV